MKYTLLVLFLIVACYFIWTQTGRAMPEKRLGTIVQAQQIGQNADKGNLLGIQPWMETADYASQESFRNKLAGYFQDAQKRSWLVPNKTIVVLPEYLGTWLVAMNEKNSVYSAQTVTDALTTMVLTHPVDFLTNYITAPESVQNKTKYAVFAMKSKVMADAYQQTFSALASMYHVTIVAGSILLQNPGVTASTLTVNTGQLYNISVVFRPDGRVDSQLVKKVYLITDELPFICPARAADVPVFDTPVGKLGILVCADSWYPEAYKTLRQKGATLLAVPSYSAGQSIWSSTWQGYSGMTTPSDARASVGHITEGQAWLKYAMAGRATPEAGIEKGMNVFLRGNLWDLGSDGTTVSLNTQEKQPPVPITPVHPVTKRVDGASLTCLWL